MSLDQLASQDVSLSHDEQATRLFYTTCYSASTEIGCLLHRPIEKGGGARVPVSHDGAKPYALRTEPGSARIGTSQGVQIH